MNTFDRIQKRIFDLIVSIIFILFFLPVMILVAPLVWVDLNKIFFKQERVGRNGQIFKIWKFKTRKTFEGTNESEVDFNNERLTELGAILRRFKLDELPQLFQVLIGQMSIIGPRPELPEYIKYYAELRARILTVKPGLIDLAVISYFNEDRLLLDQKDPKAFYTDNLLKAKLNLSIKTIDHNESNRLLIIIRSLLNVLRSSYKDGLDI